jgi:hypothetical protein
MPAYRAGKAQELDRIADWLQSELAALKAARPEHGVILGYLNTEFEKVERELGLFAAILDDPALERRAHVLLQGITRYVVTTTSHYLAGLRRQSAEDQQFRHVLLGIARRLRLDWIEDLMACLYRELGVVAKYRDLPCIPVFYGPPHLLETIFELTGVYHEFGHSVSAKHRQFGGELMTTIHRHFKEVKDRPGPLTPEQKETRDKAIDQFRERWTEAVISEIFCDVFGAYACGTAYFALMVDLGISRGRDPYLQTSSTYPPTCARVSASWHALLPEQQNCATAQKIHEGWQRYTQCFPATQRYRIGFSEELVGNLATQVLTLLQAHLPDTPRYCKCLPSVVEAQAIAKGVALEDLVNSGVSILFDAPQEFAAWQQSARLLIA